MEFTIYFLFSTLINNFLFNWYSRLKFGTTKFLLLAIASKTIVEPNAITTFASSKNFSPGPLSIKVKFFGKELKLNWCFLCTPVLPLRIILSLFDEGKGTIIDPYIGSGTTAVACKNTDRRCIGIELNSDYYKICLDRLQ